MGDPTGAALAGIQLSEQRIASYADLIAGPEVANQVAYELGLDQTPEVAALATSPPVSCPRR